MASYSYAAVDPRGLEQHGLLEVADQSEALRRIKEMGLFPIRIARTGRSPTRVPAAALSSRFQSLNVTFSIPFFGGRVKPARLATFTRQLATLVEAGMPLLRGLRILQEQEENRILKHVLGQISAAIENGSSLTEAVSAHPKVFNRLFVNMVRAGEIGGALETTLLRLAEFMEKAQKIRGKVKAAMVYPSAVLAVAFAIVMLLVTFVVPRFQQVFEGLLNGAPLPAFTRLIFSISQVLNHQWGWVVVTLACMCSLLMLALRTRRGRWVFDRAKLSMPALGPVFRKSAISRFARTLGTLITNGVPILQALTIVKETAGNVVLGEVVSLVHEQVKQGDPLALTLKASSLFPAMVAGMIDVGEQTGALPNMLLKIADNYDDEVDNAASAMTSLLEPVMIVFLAVIVGSIVVAMFLPIITVATGIDTHGGEGE